MKKNILVLFSLFVVSTCFGQYLVWGPETQTVSGVSGSVITAKVTVSCQGTEGQFASYFLSPCDDDGYFKSIDWQNGNVYVGNEIEITFKFKKPASTSSSSYTYTFKKDFGNCEDTDKISITVNYGPASCGYDPQVFNASSSPNSITPNWSKDPNVKTYYLHIKKSNEKSWSGLEIISASVCDIPNCSYTYSGLLPSTTYNIRLRAECNNGIFSGYVYHTVTTKPCSPNAPTNLNATIHPYQGYTILFTPVTGTTKYTLEAVDLVTNATSGTSIFYSSTPNGGNHFYAIPSDHSFKFRLQTPCSGAYSAWKTITPPSCFPNSYPTNLAATSPCGSMPGHSCGNGNFSWSSVTGATQYEAEILIYNTTGGIVQRSFACTGNAYTYSNLYASSSQGPWYLKFRVRSKCNDGSWSDFSPYSTPIPW